MIPDCFNNSKIVKPPELSTPSSEDRLALINSWFLGPRAENQHILTKSFEIIVNKVENARKSYFPDDQMTILEKTEENRHIGRSFDSLIDTLGNLADHLSQSSAPFFSPRYAAHMTSDTTLPGTIGYILGILFNQNNVAPEGGPFTTLLEYIVGQELCSMLGFRQPLKMPIPKIPSNSQQMGVEPWGHLTSGGSISNLEAMWVARNLKYYPLSLKCAMEEGNPLDFASSLNVNLCDGTSTQFGECEAWQLLNLTPTEILDLPSRLHSEFGILPERLEGILKEYNTQSVGKAWLDDHFGINQPAQFLVSCVSHYSMAKGTAILGIGCKNVTEIKVDFDARMDTEHLRTVLNDCLQRRRAVLAVIVIAGSTEHGAVDPISKVLEIREEFQEKGLSFMIHADAAWGGYFTTLLIDSNSPFNGSQPPDPPFVLRPSVHTKNELLALRHVDSVTVDPHKSGYIPYPAGAICYRDGRLRYLVAWKSPVLNIGEKDTCVGIYGIAGSKPGAAALAVYLSHAVINLDMTGYGTLLGTALFNGIKMYMRLATMTFRHEGLMVVPFKMLESEKKGPPNPDEIRAEKDKIIKWLSQSNEQLEGDKKEIAELGSDLVINPFSCNFYIDGKPNQDVVESNFLNDVLYRRLSIHSINDDISKIPMILYSTRFNQRIYGPALTRFRERLGLYSWDSEDVVALSNTSMFPSHTSNDLLDTIMRDFKKIAEQEVKSIIKYRYPRWKIYPCIHAFLLQGTDTIHLVHFPVFNVANHRKQIIATAKLPRKVMAKYRAAFELDPTEPLCIFTKNHETLEETLERGSFLGDIYHGSPFRYLDPEFKPIIKDVKLTKLKPIKVRSLSRFDLPKDYPVKMPFYLYGTSNKQHIDHILLRAPNVQLSATQVKLELDIPLNDRRMIKGLKNGLIAIMEGIHERVMQPFGERNPPKFFQGGKSFKVKIYEDPNPRYGISHLESSDSKNPKSWDNGRDGDLSIFGIEQDVDGVKEFILPKLLTEGQLTLGNSVWHDYTNLNRDIGPAEKVPDHCPMYPIFQMRADDKWMKAFQEETELNPVPSRKSLLGGVSPLLSEGTPRYESEMDIIKELQAHLHIPPGDGLRNGPWGDVEGQEQGRVSR